MGLAALLTSPYWLIRGLRHGKYLSNLGQRLGFSISGLEKLPAQHPGAIWIHAVSVGEALSGITLARRLKDSYPKRPLVVSTKALKPTELAGKRIGVPGLKTSAYLTLKLYEPDFEPVVMPFDKIVDAVQNNLVEAGLLIHEGQLFFPKLGLHRIVDLGVWWQEETGLPLPLGGNAVRRALGPQVGRQIAKTIRDSVSYGLEHREEALNYAMQFAREMDAELADKFVGMYVNNWTLGYGEKGQQAVKELIKRGTKAGLLPAPPTVEFLAE